MAILFLFKREKLAKRRVPQGVFILGHRKKWLELGRTRAFTAIFGEDFRKSGRIEKEDKKSSVFQ